MNRINVKNLPTVELLSRDELGRVAGGLLLPKPFPPIRPCPRPHFPWNVKGVVVDLWRPCPRPWIFPL